MRTNAADVSGLNLLLPSTAARATDRNRLLSEVNDVTT